MIRKIVILSTFLLVTAGVVGQPSILDPSLLSLDAGINYRWTDDVCWVESPTKIPSDPFVEMLLPNVQLIYSTSWGGFDNIGDPVPVEGGI